MHIGIYIFSRSHAISGYLVNKYGKDDALYPREPRKRATVDQRLHFDSGIGYPEFRNIVVRLVVQMFFSLKYVKKIIVSSFTHLMHVFIALRINR